MVLGTALSTAAEIGKFAWNDLGVGKFVKKNAGKLIGSVVKRMPEKWKNKAIAAGEYAADKANKILGKDNEIAENITTGVKEAKGVNTEFKLPLRNKDEDEKAPQPMPQAMPQPQSQTIRYINALGKAKHIRLRRRINRLPNAHTRARLKLNSSKFTSKKRLNRLVRS